MVTLTTDNHDWSCRHGWFLDDIGQWLATGRVRWRWQRTDELWVRGRFAPQHAQNTGNGQPATIAAQRVQRRPHVLWSACPDTYSTITAAQSGRHLVAACHARSNAK
jgi:hypothetical protein